MPSSTTEKTMKTLVPFAVVYLLTAVASVSAGSCADLTWYKGSNFMNSARVHTAFLGLIEKINSFAVSCNVKDDGIDQSAIVDYCRYCVHITVYVTSSFRKSGQVIKGAIVKPASRSNHYVGHAIDMNVVTVVKSTETWCNSKCLQYSPNQYPDVECFIKKIRDDPDLRWGGDFSQKDVVHIDDGINLRNPSYYDQLYNNLQKNC